jgi:hypothetical protein
MKIQEDSIIVLQILELEPELLLSHLKRCLTISSDTTCKQQRYVHIPVSCPDLSYYHTGLQSLIWTGLISRQRVRTHQAPCKGGDS